MKCRAHPTWRGKQTAKPPKKLSEKENSTSASPKSEREVCGVGLSKAPRMTTVARYGGDLAARLYPRYSGEYENVAALDQLMHEDAVVALIQFLFIGIERHDLHRDEVNEALELARAGRLLKSNAYLLDALTEYQRSAA